MRWTVARTICLLVGLALLGVCAREACFSVGWDRRFEVWATEVPARFTLDPSSTKEVSATMHHTCTVGHSQQILLRVLNSDGTPAPEEFWPKRLDAVFSLDSIDHPEQSCVIESSMGNYDLAPAMVEANGLLLMYHVFGQKGDYRLRVVLNKPHEAPAGVVYEISVRNLLCGMEKLPGFIAGVVSVVSGLVGLAFAIPSGVKIARGSRAEPK